MNKIKLKDLDKNEEKIFCPKCKSFDVKKEITASLALGVPQNWICNSCGFSNMIFPELKKLKSNK